MGDTTYSHRPILDRQPVNLLEVTVAAYAHRPSCQSGGGNPQVILIQCQSSSFAGQLDRCVMVARGFRHRLAREHGKKFGRFGFQLLAPPSLRQTLDTIADFAPHH